MLTLLYKEKSDSLQKIAQEMNLQHKIFEIQQKNEADKLVVENKLLMQEKQIQLYFLAATVFILYSCGICSISGNKKNNIERVIENALKGLWRRSSKLIKRMKR